MNEKIQWKGIILSNMPVGENDRRITVLTKESGKITAFAKGARRPNSPLVTATMPFSFGDFEFYVGRNSYSLVKADIKNHFDGILKDLDATYYGCYYLEMADYFTQEGMDETNILSLLYATLRATEKAVVDPKLIRCIYELKMLFFHGIYPNVFTCPCCGTKEHLEIFSVKKAGILCGTCGKLEGGYKLQASTVYALQYILSVSLEELFSFTVTDEILKQLQRVVHSFYEVYIQHKFKSKSFL